MKYDSKVTYICRECSADFVIQYNKDLVEDEPKFCPCCASYIEEEESVDEDSEIYEDDEDDE